MTIESIYDRSHLFNVTFPDIVVISFNIALINEDFPLPTGPVTNVNFPTHEKISILSIFVRPV